MSNTTNSDHTRLVIRDAMDRLLKSKPIRSDGKLTIKSLAEEAGVKRWILTHKHPDLQAEFRDKVSLGIQLPSDAQSVIVENEALKIRVAEQNKLISDLTQENHEMARVIQVQSLENTALKEALEGGNAVVRRIRPI